MTIQHRSRTRVHQLVKRSDASSYGTRFPAIHAAAQKMFRRGKVRQSVATTIKRLRNTSRV